MAAKPRSSKSAPKGPTVAVVGGGLGGLTAALKLAECGFRVTLYEAHPQLGGNISAEPVNGVLHDVYPHMFCAWYANFWNIFETSLGLKRDEMFSAREGVKLLECGHLDYQELRNGNTFASGWANMNSGVMSGPDMFLSGFMMLDLAATPFNRSKSDLLERLDVNGFIYSRGYTNEQVAKFQNYILQVIWSIQSNVTAAVSYQDFIKHSFLFPDAAPFCWLAKGSLHDVIIEPFQTRLEALGAVIRTGERVMYVEVDKDRAPTLYVQSQADINIGGTLPPPEVVRPDFVVMAVPGWELARLAMTRRPEIAPAVGEPPPIRIVDYIGSISEAQRFVGEPIPVVDIYFNKRIEGIPSEQVGLRGSGFELTMLDISQLWEGMDPDRTVLVIAASNAYALTSEAPLEQGFEMIQMLYFGYLNSFRPGAYWGDPDSDIDWTKTHYRPNTANLLFLNDVGSWEWRPSASYKALPAFAFAGDYCRTDVDMATVESAVESGILAAQAIQSQDAAASGEGPRGQPIALTAHRVYSDTTFLALKLALLPSAYAATAVSAVREAIAAGPQTDEAPNRYSQLAYCALLPAALYLDLLKTSYWLVKKAVPLAQPLTAQQAAEAGVAPEDDTIGLVEWASLVTQELVKSLGPKPGAPPTPKLGEAFAAFSVQAARTLGAAIDQGTAKAGESWRRRWRVKS